MALEKTNFRFLTSIKNKTFVLFGSGNIANKTIRGLSKKNISHIVDNSKNLQGDEYKGLKIKNPDSLDKDKHIVLICSTAISSISEQLNKMGFNENKNYFSSPVINDLLVIDQIENINCEFYFTSGTASNKNDKYGGGLYKCVVRGDNHELHQLYKGPCYGAVGVNKDIYFIDTDAGVHCLSNKEQITKKSDLPKGARAHGISFNEDNGNFYVTCSYLDAVLEYDNKFNLIKTFKLSNKIDETNEPMHHCNDNFSIGNSLFVSMFSSSGNWKLDAFDGCIAEFDISTGERLNDVASGLYMPHNVKIYNSSIHVLDSLPGHLRYGNLEVQSTFPAFARGLDCYGGYYFIGQSKNRNYSRVIGLSNNISIDCGVVVWDPSLKISRFLQFPNHIGEVHSIVVSN